MEARRLALEMRPSSSLNVLTVSSVVPSGETLGFAFGVAGDRRAPLLRVMQNSSGLLPRRAIPIPG